MPTPKPCSYNDRSVVCPAGSDGLVSMFLQQQNGNPSLVTPEYPQRQTIQSASAASSDSLRNSRQISLVMSSEALAVSNGHGHGHGREQPALAPRSVKSGTRCAGPPPSIPLISSRHRPSIPTPTESQATGPRLNKFVRRLHDMLQTEKDSGIVEWRRGLLVLYSTDVFAKTILPKYFNTRNFKTFRRQLNYYGFVHVRSFSTTGSSTTALWVNRDLAKEGTDDISSVLRLRRVEPCEAAKTAEGRRYRKELAIVTVEEDIGVSAKSLQLEQIRSMALRTDHPSLGQSLDLSHVAGVAEVAAIPKDIQIQTSERSDRSMGHHDCATKTTSAATATSATLQGEETATRTSPEEHESASAAKVLLMLSRA